MKKYKVTLKFPAFQIGYIIIEYRFTRSNLVLFPSSASNHNLRLSNVYHARTGILCQSSTNRTLEPYDRPVDELYPSLLFSDAEEFYDLIG